MFPNDACQVAMVAPAICQLALHVNLPVAMIGSNTMQESTLGVVGSLL